MAVIKFLEKTTLYFLKKRITMIHLYLKGITAKPRVFREQVVIFPWCGLFRRLHGEEAAHFVTTAFLCCQCPVLTVYDMLSHFVFLPTTRGWGLPS